jgi:TusA-related sulfurtransferase
VFRGEGYWQGQAEKSLLLEVYTNNKKLIRSIAERIKEHNQQQAVLVTETKCKIELV